MILIGLELLNSHSNFGWLTLGESTGEYSSILGNLFYLIYTVLQSLKVTFPR